MNDRRAALEAIAFGADADVRPSDRLRALELLQEESPADPVAAHLAGLSEEQLDREIDQLFAPSFLASFTGSPSHWPQLAALFESEVERRTAERLGTLRAVRKIEREREKVAGEVERRAQLLAQQKYARREFEVVSRADGGAADEPVAEVKKAAKPPDATLGWNDSPRRPRLV